VPVAAEKTVHAAQQVTRTTLVCLETHACMIACIQDFSTCMITHIATGQKIAVVALACSGSRCSGPRAHGLQSLPDRDFIDLQRENVFSRISGY